MLTTFDPDTNNNQFNLNQDQRLIFFSPLRIHRAHCVEPILPNKEVNICCRDVMMLIIIGVISQSAGQLVSRLASGAPLASDSGAEAAPDPGTDNRQRPETWNQCLSDNLTPGGRHWSVSWSAPDNIRFHKLYLYQSGVTGRLTRRHFTTLDISWTVLAGVITVLIELDFDFFLAHYKPP